MKFAGQGGRGKIATMRWDGVAMLCEVYTMLCEVCNSMLCEVCISMLCEVCISMLCEVCISMLREVCNFAQYMHGGS